jgi:hypothetical protein
MSNTREYAVESIVIALLATSSAFSGVQIVHKEEDTAAAKDRVIVSAAVKTPELPGFRPQANPIAWSSLVSIDARLSTRDAATIETWGNAIDALLQASAPGSVASLAASLFPSQNLDLYAAEGGERQGEDTEIRQRVRNLKAVWTE